MITTYDTYFGSISSSEGSQGLGVYVASMYHDLRPKTIENYVKVYHRKAVRDKFKVGHMFGMILNFENKKIILIIV